MFIEISSEPNNVDIIQEINAPTITFCALNSDAAWSLGWKNLTGDYDDMVIRECGNPSSVEEATRCIHNKTYSFDETIKLAKKGSSKYENISEAQFRKSDITMMPMGKCHKINYPGTLGSKMGTNILWFELNSNLIYDITVNDPNFYLMTLNPAVIPGFQLRKQITQESKQFDIIFISVTRHVKLNRPGKPCNDSKEYSFSTCVKESVPGQLGAEWNGMWIVICPGHFAVAWSK